MSRFDYVKYNEISQDRQEYAKTLCTMIENFLKDEITTVEAMRAKALAITKLEECYMWIGKAIRDDQIGRGMPAPLQEERKEG